MMIDADSIQPGGAEVSIRKADGTEIVSFVPQKEWINLVISHPDIAEGEEIRLYVNDQPVSAAKARRNAGRGMFR